jgi:plastocyanin
VPRYAVVWCVVALLTLSCGAAPGPSAATAAATATLAATTAPAASTATAPPTITASPTATAAVALIEMGDNFFDPAQLTVKAGTTVTWKVVGQSTHDLAARDGSFLNRTMSFGQTFSFTFTKAGRYGYVCMQHEGDGMTGEVTVID